jgi:uncharacterized phage protein (TIGR02216 family)
MSRRADWAALMRLGLGRLRLAPKTFWSMTPREFAAAVEGAGLTRGPAGALPRERLDALMRAHPDRRPDRAAEKERKG